MYSIHFIFFFGGGVFGPCVILSCNSCFPAFKFFFQSPFRNNGYGFHRTVIRFLAFHNFCLIMNILCTYMKFDGWH